MREFKLKTGVQSPAWVNIFIGLVTLVFLSLFLLLPLIVIFGEALRQGVGVWVQSVTNEEARAAIRLTLLVAVLVVPLNLIFKVIAAWALAKFQFPGRNFLITLIDLPFAVSPVIAGLIFVLLFGAQGWWGPWLMAHHLQIIFAVP